MKRVQTKYEYHDSDLVCTEWAANDELVLDFDLRFDDIVASVRFQDVRNRDEVEGQLRAIASHEPGSMSVVGIWREDDGTFLIDTSRGALTIAASGMLE